MRHLAERDIAMLRKVIANPERYETRNENQTPASRAAFIKACADEIARLEKALDDPVALERIFGRAEMEE